jgi:hypothetical protein
VNRRKTKKETIYGDSKLGDKIQRHKQQGGANRRAKLNRNKEEREESKERPTRD